MRKEIKKEKNIENKRKYEFKSEKKKKKIVISSFIGLAIALIISGISLGGLKIYSSIKNNNLESTTKNATINSQITYSGLNSGIILNANSYYGIGTKIKPGNSSYIYTGINDTISITAPVVKNPARNTSYRFTTYDNTNKKISTGACKVLTRASGTINVTETFTLKTSISSYGVFEIFPNSSNCSGIVLNGSPRTVKISPTPSIGTYLGNTKVNSNEALKVNKLANYNLKMSIYNVSGQKLYYRWYTYNSFNWNSLYYNEATCSAVTTTTTKEPDLKLFNSNPERMGYMRVYANYNDCMADNNVQLSNNYNNKNGGKINYVSSFIVKLQYLPNNVYSTGSWKRFSYNKSNLETKIGSQTEGNCQTYAKKYANYIKSGATNSTSSSKSNSAGSYTNLYKIIKEQVSMGKPVVIHVKTTTTHWVTVTGYNLNVDRVSTAKEFMNNVYVLDPYSRNCKYNSKKTGGLYEGTIKNDQTIRSMYNTQYILF